MGVPAHSLLLEECPEHLALECSEHAGCPLLDVLPPVEPDVLELDRLELGILEQLDDAIDVVGIDVGDDEQLKVGFAPIPQLAEPFADPSITLVGKPRTPVDEDPAHRVVAVADDQGVTVPGGQHLYFEHFNPLPE